MTDKKRNILIHLLLNVILPITIGFCYYYLFCPDIIVVKKIESIVKIGYHLRISDNFFTQVIRFYLLDAIWAYSLTHCIFIIIGNNARAFKTSIIIASLMSIAMEVSQLLNITAGTFDVFDIGVEILAVLVASVIIVRRKKGEYYEKKCT